MSSVPGPRLLPMLQCRLPAWRSCLRASPSPASQPVDSRPRANGSERHRWCIRVADPSHVANPEYAAYAASKAGVAHLTRVLAVEWAPHGVTVNAIGPAVTPTPLAQPILDDAKQRAGALARIPMGRFGTPQNLEGAAVFLASDAGGFVTGQVIYVDGGRTLS